MKIINQNCDGSIPKSYKNKLAKADILIIQEIRKENTEIIDENFKYTFWQSSINRKGILTATDLKIKKCYDYSNVNTAQTIILEDLKFPITNIWARKEPYKSRYIWQVNNLVKSIGKPHIIAGDFNWNLSVEKGNPPVLFNDLISKMNNKNMYSIYHHQNENIGSETMPTLKMKTNNKLYHHDFVFAPKCLNNVELEFKDNFKNSDHIMMEINL